MASAPKTLAKSLFITLLENYPNRFSPTVFFRQAFFVVIAFALLLIPSGTQQKHEENEAKAAIRDQTVKIGYSTVIQLMVGTGDNAIKLCAQHLEYWSTTTPAENVNEQLRVCLKTIKEQIQELDSQSDNNRETYNKLVSAYGTLSVLCELAMVPSGNKITYGDSVRRNKEKLISELNQISVTTPKP